MGLMRGAVGVTLSAVVVFTIATGRPDARQAADPPDARALYSAAVAAHERKEYAEYLRLLRELAALRPAHPVILYRLAGAYALNARPAETAAALKRLARLAVYRDPASDPEFAASLRHAEVRRAIAALDRVRERRIGSGSTALTVPDPMLVPEGVAYDPRTRSFFVSSQYERKIVRVDERGGVSDFVREAQDGIWMVFGIAVDPSRPWLWAVSTSDKSMKGFTDADAGRAGLFAFDLDSGRLVKKLAMEPSDPAPYFDDVALANDGRVFVSDGGIGAMYTLDRDAQSLRMLVPPGTIQGPNGIAVAPDGRTLFVSDYAGFIFRVDTGSGRADRLRSPNHVALFGIDGLAWHTSGLIGVQNGVEPARVVRLRLSRDGAAVAAVDTLEMNNPAFAEPTLGVVVGDTFYCVANSHGGVLRRTADVVTAGRLSPPALVRIDLK